MVAELTAAVADLTGGTTKLVTAESAVNAGSSLYELSSVSEALITISGNVRHADALQEVLVATKMGCSPTRLGRRVVGSSSIETALRNITKWILRRDIPGDC